MIKTTKELMKDYSKYHSPKNKISREVKNGKIILLKKGIYETDKDADPFFLSSVIYGPSYISFYTALSFYGLIPERACVVNCATLNKSKRKKFINSFSTYTYRDVPKKVFGIDNIRNFDLKQNPYYIASKEKALLDTLYILPKIGNRKELLVLLFDDLRIDEHIFYSLDKNRLIELASLYQTKNHKILISYLRSKNYDKHYNSNRT